MEIQHMIIRNKLLLSLGCLLLLFIAGCGSPEEMDKTVAIKVPVTLTGIQIGEITDYVDLIATSSYFSKSVIQAPTSVYVEEVFINPGAFVRKNDVLLTIKTKEAEALQMDSVNPLNFSGVIRIKAAIDGIITTVDHPKGDFVMEGATLATIAVPGSLVFLLEVPYELTDYMRINTNCEILLPDNKKIPATIKSRLPMISGSSQTQKFIIQPTLAMNLPENLIAKIRIIRKVSQKAQILPKTSVLTDEVMKAFWVMKMINDSTAVKVPVKTGISQGDNIEISDPVFNSADRFLNSSNYGLGDTARVFVVNRIDK
jgi:hypothetical protein